MMSLEELAGQTEFGGRPLFELSLGCSGDWILADVNSGGNLRAELCVFACEDAPHGGIAQSVRAANS